MRSGRGMASRRSVLKYRLERNGKSLEDWKRKRDRHKGWGVMDYHGRRPVHRHKPGGNRV